MAGDLKGRAVAITGASSGIGEATALACVEAGAAVALAARRTDRIEALAERINSRGGKAVAIATDVADEAQAHAFVQEAAKQLGGLHALVNNAGVMLLGPIEGADTEHWRRMIDVNCLGLLYCTQAAMPLIRESGGGDIVNIASVAGRRASFGSGVYNMTKFGVVGFTESLRQEAANSNIRATVIEPGFVETELQGHNKHSELVMGAVDKMREEIGDVLVPADIADAILYVLTRPAHVAVNEVLVRPAQQRQ